MRHRGIVSSLFLMILVFHGAFGADVQPEAKPTSSDDQLSALLADVHAKYRDVQEGYNASYIPVLAQVDSNLFGIAIMTVDGRLFETGDSRHEFAIESISKAFTLCRIIEDLGPAAIRKKTGVNATGLPFNSVMAIELQHGKPDNPFVNAGAMAATSLVPGKDATEQWKTTLGTMSDFAGRELTLNKEVCVSELDSNEHNRAIAMLLESYGYMYGDPLSACTLYTKQCSVNVTASDLATMAAVLANGGTHPVTGKALISESYVPNVLAVMAIAGLYNTSGAWLYRTGLPAKSGVGGGLLVVVPGKMGIGLFSPPLDKAGNSVRGQKAAIEIIDRLKLNLLSSRPVTGHKQAETTQ